MATDAEVLHALLHAQGRSVAELAKELGMTRQHAHRLLTGRRSAGAREADLDRALALGQRPATGKPVYGVATLESEGLELVPAGDTQPLFASRDLAARVAAGLQESHRDVCVVPVWPGYAWRQLTAFHAAWGVRPEPRKIFLVDDSDPALPVEVVLEELRTGFGETLRLRTLGRDPSLLAEVERALDRVH
jgi:transcriptional regulator with XRE-family HTH domain